MNSIVYFELFSILRTHGENLKDYRTLLKHILVKNEFNFSASAEKHLTEPLRKFSCHLYERWCKSNRIYADFIKRNDSWLRTTFRFPEEALITISAETEPFEPEPSTSVNIKQRQDVSFSKRKSFSNLSDRQKRRRTELLRAENTIEELAFALKLKMQASGNVDGAAILSFIIEHPEQTSRFRTFCEGKRFEEVKMYSKEKAVALMLNLGLSKSKYEELRKMSIEQGINPYPSYYQIQLAKKDCYPPKEAIAISDTYASIKLQSLLDLTTYRLLETCNIETYSEIRNLKLISKWGFDGASCQSLYKQAFADQPNDCDKPRDDSIFTTCLVPLKLVNGSIIIWENMKPSSTKYCRPVKFEFIKENDEIIRRENQRMSTEIEALIPTHYKDSILVEHELLLTMVDGKVCASLTEFSSMRCFICGVKPKDMNNFDLICKKSVTIEHYKFGLSSLHGWIRCMEFLLHVSYNLEIKKWSTRDAQEKLRKEKRKKKIQEEFRQKLGLLIDVIKQGVGSTNDGNTARKFFEKPSVTAEITGLDEQIIRKFAVVLQAIASGRQIDPQKFDHYAKNLARLIIEKYGWYYMPATVHKILFHGSEIIKYAIVPIGQLSEEVIEARHKQFRKYRLENTRKISRKATNTDLLHHLLISSDPIISSLRPDFKKSKEQKMFSEVQELFVQCKENSENEEDGYNDAEISESESLNS